MHDSYNRSGIYLVSDSLCMIRATGRSG